MGKLEGKVAIVTGASRGIGKTIAQVLGAEGAKVVCAARTLNEGDHKFFEGSINTTASLIKKAGGIAIAVQTDVAKEDQRVRLIETTKKEFGPVDLLVNNAAQAYYLRVKDMPLWRARYALEVDFWAPYTISQMVLPDMIARHSGAIVNISSGGAVGPGRGPYKNFPVGSTIYSSQKAALERFTQGLAMEVYQYGITVACVAPSLKVIIPATEYVLKLKGLTLSMDKHESAEMTAKAVVLLASEPLDKVTGRVTYAQAILKEFGWINKAEGRGTDYPGTGFSQI